MGFRKKEKVYVLKFSEDSELSGLEVRMSGASTGQLMDLMDLARVGSGERFSSQDVEKISGLYELFGSKLISWNLEDSEGKAIPVSDFMGEDPEMLNSLILAWVDAIMGVPAPLGQRSTDGEQFPGGSIPMETL